MKRIALAVAGLVAGVAALSACSITSDDVSDPSMATLRYEGGDFSGSKFKSCVEPGSKLASNDRFYSYPATQREDIWDTDNYNQGSKSADHPDLELTDKNGVKVYAKVKVSFLLNTDCKAVEANGKTYKGGTLQAFHEIIGKTRGAYFDPKKSGNDAYTAGWLWAMDNYISGPAQNNLKTAARGSTADAMWLNNTVKDDMQDALFKALPGLINDGMETDLQFYNIANVQIQSLTPDDTYIQLYRDRQSAQVKAQTAEANKDAQIKEAQAKAAVANAEAAAKQAEIRGYGGIEGYLKHEAIEKGLNPFPYTGGSPLVTTPAK